jgi:2-polyprenyl-6-methoxyphenol hydroxylase-like FAD-dependent oxidoreductase
MKNRNILISGAGVAGLSLAYWLRRYNFNPTVVEYAPALRDSGYKVDIRGSAVKVIENMGIMPQVLQSTVGMLGASFVNRMGKHLASMDADLFGGRERGDIEVMRGDFVRILYEATSPDAEFLFNNSIASLFPGDHGVDVTFVDGQTRTFDLVVGADGLHSNVRALMFGEESCFIRNLGHYIAIFSTPNHWNLDRWELLYATPGKTVNVYSTGRNVDAKIYLMFTAPSLHYDYRDLSQQKRIVTDVFTNGGWDVPLLLDQLSAAPDFYFDAISQVYMDCWSKERVVLLGDASYCASPASGQGTSLALVGAYILAGELVDAGGAYQYAFYRYEEAMREYVKRNQDLAEPNLKGMVLKNSAQIWFQTQMIRLLPHLPGKEHIIGRVSEEIHRAATAIEIKNYA